MRNQRVRQEAAVFGKVAAAPAPVTVRQIFDAMDPPLRYAEVRRAVESLHRKGELAVAASNGRTRRWVINPEHELRRVEQIRSRV